MMSQLQLHGRIPDIDLSFKSVYVFFACCVVLFFSWTESHATTTKVSIGFLEASQKYFVGSEVTQKCQRKQ